MPTKIPHCLSVVRKHGPLLSDQVVFPLAHIWDEVVHRITLELMGLATSAEFEPHINMRGEMTLELARLQIWLGEGVVERRINNRPLNTINPDVEREACLGPNGVEIISGTARMAYDHIWKKITDERWKPKSAKALEREKTPRKTKLAVKPVGKNHFIPKSFLKTNWATNDKILRWRPTDKGWTSFSRNFGQWGYRKGLYSDELEAYFSLLEGDATQPIQMLLDMRPLNDPQRSSFVGFLIIQMLRNPDFIEGSQKALAPVIAESGHGDDPTMARRAYETLFQNNELYDRFARPIMWSRWAIVKSEKPVFVLPDRFSVNRDLGDGLRVIVPLTPRACFVTLLDREEEKDIIPHHLPADQSLARRISATLIEGAGSEFVSHLDFVPDQTKAVELEDLLNDIADAITVRVRERG
ncbi:DUF4238 domain-containing protein [Pacificibacter maritimus]|nr:DUF4238 domain-containing protein [Pacificibacter maritimus]